MLCGGYGSGQELLDRSFFFSLISHWSLTRVCDNVFSFLPEWLLTLSIWTLPFHSSEDSSYLTTWLPFFTSEDFGTSSSVRRWGVSPAPPGRSPTPAGCPAIHLISDADPTGRGVSATLPQSQVVTCAASDQWLQIGGSHYPCVVAHRTQRSKCLVFFSSGTFRTTSSACISFILLDYINDVWIYWLIMC